MRIVSCGFVLGMSLLVACGGGGGGDGDDVVLQPDAEVVDQPDAEPPAPVCLAEASYGAATLGQQAAQSQGPAATPDVEAGFATIGGDTAPVDIIQLELYKGFGVFTGGEIVPGTYTIAGDELNYATCGVCPRIFTDCTDTACADQQFYATGGTVTITSITPNLTFTVQDLTFVEVTIDETTFQSTPVPNGCSTAVTSASFDAVVENTPGQ